MGNYTDKRFITVSRTPGTDNTPHIKLSGKWLEDQGFEIGNIVQLEVCEGFITVQKTTNKWAVEEKKIQHRVMLNEQGQQMNCKRKCTKPKKD